MSARIFHLPASIAPRGLSVEKAAEYVGVSVPRFLLDVVVGRWPDAIKCGRRSVWDKKALDLAMDRESGLIAASASPVPPDADDSKEHAALLRANIAKRDRRRA